MDSFAAVIGLWEDAEKFAAAVGVEGVTARAWRNRGSIPAAHWLAIVKAAQAAGHEEVTLELLAQLAQRPPKKEVAA